MSTDPVSADDFEIAAFDRLKPQLARLWDVVFPGDEDAYTSVIVPSLTLDVEEMAKIAGMTFYEERLLFLLMRLRNPRARIVYVTSQPVHPMVLDYYLQLLAGIPASHARSRLTMLCAYDQSPQPLTKKILDRPRLMQRIRNSIGDPAQAYLTVFNSTPLERTLAVRLGIPLNGPDPRLKHWGSKSGSRRLFKEIGVPLPYGHEDLRSSDIEEALIDIHERRPSARRAVIKLNEGFSGEGNAIVEFPPLVSASSIRDSLRHLQFSVPMETVDSYLAKLDRAGGIVEELVEAAEFRSPSIQLRINPRGDVIIASTHEQILGGPANQVYLGCLFPCDDEYRSTIQDLGRLIGKALMERGIIGRLSVDFVAWRDRASDPWNVAALEINLRMGGTTHPMLALRFLTGGELEPSGRFRGQDGRYKFYRASDNVQSPAYRGLLPEDLIEIVTLHRLDFNQRTSTGVLFHMFGAVSEFGKFGIVAIGNSRDEADDLFNRSLAVLDRETGGRNDV
ncbi:MAG: peptide ligase PGM1-related protein [Thermoanaerobaculia bacterium]